MGIEHQAPRVLPGHQLRTALPSRVDLLVCAGSEDAQGDREWFAQRRLPERQVPQGPRELPAPLDLPGQPAPQARMVPSAQLDLPERLAPPAPLSQRLP